MIEINTTLAGYYKMEAVSAKTGKKRLLADWFPNLITDYGLNALPNGKDKLFFFLVGSGTAAPATTDTSLASLIASTSTQEEGVTGAQSTAPYYGWRRVTKRFGEGVAAGNISEVGVAENGGTSSSPTPGSLFSRALILDGNGDPTTITVLADEYLDVTYEIRLIAPVADLVEVVTDPETSIEHTVTLRPSGVTEVSAGTQQEARWGGYMIANSEQQMTVFRSTLFEKLPRTYTGAIGTQEQRPSGTTIADGSTSSSIGGMAVESDAYSNNSLERTGRVIANLSISNGTIQSLLFGFRGGGEWQAEFNPAIVKTDTEILTFGVKIAWARA